MASRPARLILVCLAFGIVYPDKVLPWVGDHTGLVFAPRHTILFEAFGIGVMMVATSLLMQVSARLDWWEPVVCLGVVGFWRLLFWLSRAVVRSLFDL
jgi:hypothetical protein